MDAEHRHELKTNELADWMAHFPEFCKKNISRIIGFTLIGAAVISYFVFEKTSQSANLEQQAQTTSQLQAVENNKLEVLRGVMSGAPVEVAGFEDTANTLLIAANEAKEPHFAALVLIKRGEALRSDLHFKAGEVEKGTIATQIAIAKEAYTEALAKAKGNSTLSAMATYGLGLCEEELGDFKSAAEIFIGIANSEDFKGTIFPAQAQYRLDVMADNEKQFTFIVAATPEVVVPEGFDTSAAEALQRGDIYMEMGPVAPPVVDTEVPVVETEAVQEAEKK